jgi:hypothetical protein
MRNKTANIYTEWLPLIESLQDDVAGKVFKCILKYQNGEDIDSQNPIWLFIKSKLDEFNNKYANIAESRRNAGVKGGLAKASKCQQKLAKDSKSKQNLANVAIKENKIKQNKIKQYGELGNVNLTEEEYEALKANHSNLDNAIEVLDTWLGTSGSKNKGKNHYAYFKSNSWVWERAGAINNAKPDAVELYLQINKQKREEEQMLASAAEKAMELARQKAMNKFGG